MSNKSMKILEALNDIDDKFIAENISNKKNSTSYEKAKEKSTEKRAKSKVIYQPIF